jgi:hypothetical protein
MWWIKDPDRLKGEVSAVDALRENEPWLSAATPRLTEKLELAFEFDLLVNGETLPFTLRYPAFFPETPRWLFRATAANYPIINMALGVSFAWSIAPTIGNRT